MTRALGQQLRACGRKGLPNQIVLGEGVFGLKKVFKHDFFAATALYCRNFEGLQVDEAKGGVGVVRSVKGVGQEKISTGDLGGEKVVLKVSRQGDLLGIPLHWLGKLLCGHELENLRVLAGLEGIPQVLGRYGKTGFVYEFIEGLSLDEKPALRDSFFTDLNLLLEAIHRRRVAYVDMNKRGNILVRPDGRPAIIDFQISIHVSKRMLGLRGWSNGLLQILQREDRYHLQKHKRRLRPDLMSEKEISDSRRTSPLVETHRTLARPLTRLRRRILGMLFRKGHITLESSDLRSPENDPSRWLKESG